MRSKAIFEYLRADEKLRETMRLDMEQRVCGRTVDESEVDAAILGHLCGLNEGIGGESYVPWAWLLTPARLLRRLVIFGTFWPSRQQIRDYLIESLQGPTFGLDDDMSDEARRARDFCRAFERDLGLTSEGDALFESSPAGRRRVDKARDHLGRAEWHALMDEAEELKRQMQEAAADRGHEKTRPGHVKAMRRFIEIQGALGMLKRSTVRRLLRGRSV